MDRCALTLFLRVFDNADVYYRASGRAAVTGVGEVVAIGTIPLGTIQDSAQVHGPLKPLLY